MDEVVGVSNLDMEVDNGVKFLDLVISDNIEEELIYDFSKEFVF